MAEKDCTPKVEVKAHTRCPPKKRLVLRREAVEPKSAPEVEPPTVAEPEDVETHEVEHSDKRHLRGFRTSRPPVPSWDWDANPKATVAEKAAFDTRAADANEILPRKWVPGFARGVTSEGFIVPEGPPKAGKGDIRDHHLKDAYRGWSWKSHRDAAGMFKGGQTTRESAMEVMHHEIATALVLQPAQTGLPGLRMGSASDEANRALQAARSDLKDAEEAAQRKWAPVAVERALACAYAAGNLRAIDLWTKRTGESKSKVKETSGKGRFKYGGVPISHIVK